MCMKVTSINRWDYSEILGVGNISFGQIFCPVEFLERGQKKKKKSGVVPLGQRGHGQQVQRGNHPTRAATSKA